MAHSIKNYLITSLATMSLAFGLAGCGGGGGGDDSAINGGGTNPTVTSIVASGITLPLHGTINGHDFWPRNGADGIIQGHDAANHSTYFSGKFRVQRLTASQETSVLPPAKLTLRAVNVTTGIEYFTTTVQRGTFSPTLDLWGNGASGTWPYDVYASLGYELAAGTTVRWYLVDNGDGVANSGDEFLNAQLWQGTPFIPVLWTETQPLEIKVSPIPALEITISTSG